MGGSKIWLHNAVVADLFKRINGKSFVATQREAVIHQTVRKQADITVIRQADVGKPFYVDVTVIQQESNLKSAPRLKLTKTDHIDTWAVARVRCIRVAAKHHLKLKLNTHTRIYLFAWEKKFNQWEKQVSQRLGSLLTK